MKTLLIPTLLLTALLSSVSAKDFKLPADEPVVSLTIPDNWKAEKDGESLSATSEDEEIEISFEVNDGESIEGAIEETFGYLKKNKVQIDKASEKKQEGKVHGMDVVNFDWKGTDEDGATNISLTILGVAKNKLVLVLYWATPEGEKKNAADLKKIVESIKPAAK